MSESHKIHVVPGCDGCWVKEASAKRQSPDASCEIVQSDWMAGAVRYVDPDCALCPDCQQWFQRGEPMLDAYEEYRAALAVPLQISVNSEDCVDCAANAEEEAAERRFWGGAIAPGQVSRGAPVAPSQFGGSLACENHELDRVLNPEFDDDWALDLSDADRLSLRQRKQAAIRARYHG